MKLIRSFILSTLSMVIATLLIVSCGDDESPTPQDLTPVVTDVGTPTGEITSATIGADGGTLKSADGKLTVTIPAGALSSGTAISIQPITNEGPLAVGSAYRLKPEGITFAKPVELRFHYNDALLSGTSPDFLWIITQSESGGWDAMLRSQVDTNAKTVSVETTHFSDWTLGKFIDLSLTPSSTVLLKNQSVTLKISGFVRDNSISEDDELAPLIPIADGEEALTPLTSIPPVESRLMEFRVKQWMMNGVSAPVSNSNGSLSPNNMEATYTAPGSKPQVNPVAVSVELETTNKEGRKSMYLLNTQISVVDSDLYVLVKIDGVPYEYYQYGWNGTTPPDPNNFTLVNCGSDVENNFILTATTIRNSSEMVDLFTLELTSPSEGTRDLGCSREDGGAMMLKIGNETIYRNEKAIRTKDGNVCNDIYQCADVAMTFLTFENKFGGEVRGYFEGEIHEDKPFYGNECRNSDMHTLEGEFNLRLAR
jgi:ZU5 domain